MDDVKRWRKKLEFFRVVTALYVLATLLVIFCKVSWPFHAPDILEGGSGVSVIWGVTYGDRSSSWQSFDVSAAHDAEDRTFGESWAKPTAYFTYLALFFVLFFPKILGAKEESKIWVRLQAILIFLIANLLLALFFLKTAMTSLSPQYAVVVNSQGVGMLSVGWAIILLALVRVVGGLIERVDPQKTGSA